jgi:SAM-dependent methyltransferase
VTFQNPYLDAITAPISDAERELLTRVYGTSSPRLDSFTVQHLRRNVLAQRYAWAIPTEDVIRHLSELSPICDMGCGTGYWAWLLKQLGAEVLAVDLNPVGQIDVSVCRSVPLNHWHHDPEARPFVDITRADAASFDVPASHTLMLCWPPYNTLMASDALRRYLGNTVINDGESNGCTADDTFREELAAKWSLVNEMEIPQWDGLHDCVFVYRRAQS